jgi:hypothetical protein
VLTDRALELLPAVAGFAAGDVKMTLHQGGRIEFGALNHRWEKDIEGTPEQTYYAVPLGYRSSSSIRESRNFSVSETAWTAKGGVVVGENDGGTNVGLGELPHGDGSIAIFGSILPTQTQKERHDYGLASYAVTVSGGEVLNSILEYRR